VRSCPLLPRAVGDLLPSALLAPRGYRQDGPEIPLHEYYVAEIIDIRADLKKPEHPEVRLGVVCPCTCLSLTTCWAGVDADTLVLLCQRPGASHVCLTSILVHCMLSHLAETRPDTGATNACDPSITTSSLCKHLRVCCFVGDLPPYLTGAAEVIEIQHLDERSLTVPSGIEPQSWFYRHSYDHKTGSVTVRAFCLLYATSHRPTGCSSSATPQHAHAA
jgi:hypothetical protein